MSFIEVASESTVQNNGLGIPQVQKVPMTWGTISSPMVCVKGLLYASRSSCSRLCNLKGEICQVFNNLIENKARSQEYDIDSEGIYNVLRSTPMISHDRCYVPFPGAKTSLRPENHETYSHCFWSNGWLTYSMSSTDLRGRNWTLGRRTLWSENQPDPGFECCKTEISFNFPSF